MARRSHLLVGTFWLVASTATADPSAVDQCLSCHLTESGALNIVGLRAMQALPEEWPYLYEDAFDLNGDGIAGAMRFVSGSDGALSAKFGMTLAAGRFEDFALIAGAAHGIDLTADGVLAEVQAAFEALSPEPKLASSEALAAFDARGCTACHTPRTFDFEGQTYQPLSDFLLHQTEDGPRRTTPLWGCVECLSAPAHDWHAAQ